MMIDDATRNSVADQLEHDAVYLDGSSLSEYPYWGMFRCKELDRAPEWDGHTPEQAIERIGKLTGLIDRATTHLVLDEDGRTYCPDCGAKVAKNG